MPNPTKKPKVLKRKNIKRRTGAKSQAKQISALSTAVSKLNKRQYESVMLAWQRPNAIIEQTLGGVNAYVLPCPITPNNPFSQTTPEATEPLRWADNRVASNAAYFTKSMVFGCSSAARSSPEWIHTGSTLKWRLSTNEPTFSTYSLYLIQAKSRQADQLISDRQLKNMTTLGIYPGSGGVLNSGSDYITHQSQFGCMINKKYWKVLGQRQINFSVPGVTNLEANLDLAGGADTRNNTVIKEGTFKIPGGGSIKCFNSMPFTNTASPALGRKPANAATLGFIDEDNSKTCYLVCINDGVAADSESAKLSTLCLDHYKAVV
ncbi:MAG: hypothetical protein [Circular genetic element sp.]|nr:MAG: hypothetical protein [Circular genetic element sp.]